MDDSASYLRFEITKKLAHKEYRKDNQDNERAKFPSPQKYHIPEMPFITKKEWTVPLDHRHSNDLTV